MKSYRPKYFLLMPGSSAGSASFARSSSHLPDFLWTDHVLLSAPWPHSAGAHHAWCVDGVLNVLLSHSCEAELQKPSGPSSPEGKEWSGVEEEGRRGSRKTKREGKEKESS